MGKGKGKAKKKQAPTAQASKSAAKVAPKPEDTLQDDLDDLELEDDNNDIVEDGLDTGNEVIEVASKVPDTTLKSKEPEKLISASSEDNPQSDNVVEENGAVANPPVEKKMTRKEMKKIKKKVQRFSTDILTDKTGTVRREIFVVLYFCRLVKSS